MLRKIRSELLIQVHCTFGIGSRAETVSFPLQRLPQGPEIIELPVDCGKNRAVLIGDRLSTSGKVDDRKPAMREPERTICIKTGAVRSA